MTSSSMASSCVKPSSLRRTSSTVSAIEYPSRTGGTTSLVSLSSATWAACATAAVRGQRPSSDSATSISCAGEMSSGVGSKA